MKNPKIVRNLPARGNAARDAREWHWGVPAAQEIEWDEPDVPRRRMIEIGRLAELWILPRGGGKTVVARIPDRYIDQCHVAFDKYDPAGSDRIYLFTVPDVRRLCLADGWNPSQAIDLTAYARQIGGRHADFAYPRLKVVPLGRLSKVAYRTAKGNYDTQENDADADGLSIYVHQMGEDGGNKPGLGLDQHGRLWLAGGSYTCPIEGITR